MLNTVHVFGAAGGRSRSPDPGPGAPEDPEPDDGRPAFRRLPGQTRDGEPRRRFPGRDGLGGRRRVDQSPVHSLPPLLTVLRITARWEDSGSPSYCVFFYFYYYSLKGYFTYLPFNRLI